MAVFGQDVFDYGAGFGEGDGPIGYDGGGFEGVQGFEGGWGEEGGAGVKFEGVGEVELFAEPDYAFGLGALELGVC